MEGSFQSKRWEDYLNMQKVKFHNCFEIWCRSAISATSLASFLAKLFLTFQKHTCSSQPVGMRSFLSQLSPSCFRPFCDISVYSHVSLGVPIPHAKRLFVFTLFISISSALNKVPGSSEMVSISKIYFASLCSRKDLKCLIKIIANIIGP